MSNALRIGNRSISYEQAKEMLFPELIPQKGNEAMLSTVPHEKVEDMAVVFRLDLHSESGMMMSTRVNQAILDGFGVTADQIKQDALENAPHTHPADFRGHSLSVSDIVAIRTNGQISCHYVDSIGFVTLPEFLKPENYLKNAEMAMEDDYGMIDGIINNGKAPAMEVTEKPKEERESILEKLKAAKEPGHKPPAWFGERNLE